MLPADILWPFGRGCACAFSDKRVPARPRFWLGDDYCKNMSSTKVTVSFKDTTLKNGPSIREYFVGIPVTIQVFCLYCAALLKVADVTLCYMHGLQCLSRDLLHQMERACNTKWFRLTQSRRGIIACLRGHTRIYDFLILCMRPTSSHHPLKVALPRKQACFTWEGRCVYLRRQRKKYKWP